MKSKKQADKSGYWEATDKNCVRAVQITRRFQTRKRDHEKALKTR